MAFTPAQAFSKHLYYVQLQTTNTLFSYFQINREITDVRRLTFIKNRYHYNRNKFEINNPWQTVFIIFLINRNDKAIICLFHPSFWRYIAFNFVRILLFLFSDEEIFTSFLFLVFAFYFATFRNGVFGNTFTNPMISILVELFQVLQFACSTPLFKNHASCLPLPIKNLPKGLRKILSSIVI